jgi:Ni2+-binding GTPase involved in maturation of urease and hydrogenase
MIGRICCALTVDLAPYVGADLTMMDRDARAVRSGPILSTDAAAIAASMLWWRGLSTQHR